MFKRLELISCLGIVILFSAFRMKGETDQFKSYYPSGAVKAEFPLKDGRLEGKTTWYYESGAVGAILNYKNNRLHGPSRSYYENGVLKKEIEHENNLPVGFARYYDRKGKLINEELYKEGSRILRLKYDEEGQNLLCEEASTLPLFKQT